MKTSNIRILLTLFTVVGFLSVATVSFAQCGNGWGKGNNQGQGSCMKNNSRGCPMGINAANLTEDQIKQLGEERTRFQQETKDLRQSVYQKKLSLKAEMANKVPDTKKALKLQKELSGLKAEMAEKKLTHKLKMREIAPDAMPMGPDGNFGRGGGKGRMCQQ